MSDQDTQEAAPEALRKHSGSTLGCSGLLWVALGCSGLLWVALETTQGGEGTNPAGLRERIASRGGSVTVTIITD